ncbi:MAG: hypothetical protein JJT94_05700 [Bernardetiaceae bacterium]|nr:hypothetical protein [Bernardetiaceae bacterium]
MDKSELAELYGVSTVTLNKWLKERGLYVRHESNMTPKRLNEIFEKLGLPINHSKL